MLDKVKYYVDKLQLIPHPEGGYYKEVYRAGEIILSEALPGNFRGNRNISTSIYYLLQRKDYSAFHKLKSDEVWHFYDGSALQIYIIDQSGNFSIKLLGKNAENEEAFQIVIAKECWFAAELVDKTSFSLVGCTVSPGFDFRDFEMADCSKLADQFPMHKELIQRLCR